MVKCTVCNKQINKYSIKYCSMKCLGIDRRGKKNVWYGKPSPKTRLMKIVGITKNKNYPKKINTKDGRRILYHRYLMEKKLGRKLSSEEVVHHIDGNNQNNLLTNLKIMQNKSFHMRHHWRELKEEVMPL